MQHETYWNIMQPLSLLCGPFSHFPLLFQPMFRHFGAWTSESPWSLPPSGRTKLRNWHKTGLLVTTTVTVLLGWWDLYKLLMLTLWWNIFLWNFFQLLLTLLLVTRYGDQQDIRSNLVNGHSMKPKKFICQDILRLRHTRRTGPVQHDSIFQQFAVWMIRNKSLAIPQTAKAPAKLPWRVLILRPSQHVC